MKKIYVANTQLTYSEKKLKNRLNKIHKLKRENRVLSSRRKSLVSNIKLSQNIYLTSCAEAIISGKEFKGLRKYSLMMVESDLHETFKLSEKIGANSIKIQRLRLLIKQEKHNE